MALYPSEARARSAWSTPRSRGPSLPGLKRTEGIIGAEAALDCYDRVALLGAQYGAKVMALLVVLGVIGGAMDAAADELSHESAEDLGKLIAFVRDLLAHQQMPEGTLDFTIDETNLGIGGGDLPAMGMDGLAEDDTFSTYFTAELQAAGVQTPPEAALKSAIANAQSVGWEEARVAHLSSLLQEVQTAGDVSQDTLLELNGELTQLNADLGNVMKTQKESAKHNEDRIQAFKAAATIIVLLVVAGVAWLGRGASRAARLVRIRHHRRNRSK